MGASVLLAVAVLLSYAAIGVAAITSLNVSTILDFPGRVLSVGAASSPGTGSGSGGGGSNPTSQTPTSGLVPDTGGNGSGGSSLLSPFQGSGGSAGLFQYPGVVSPPSDAQGATGGSSSSSTSGNSSGGGPPPPPKPPKNWFSSN